MPPARSFQDLLVWQRAHAYVLALYRYTDALPRHERFVLQGQMRRAGISIPANIAEGFRKTGVPDKLRFLNIAEGSVAESAYYLILSQDLGYGDTGELAAGLTEVAKLLGGYAGGILRNQKTAKRKARRRSRRRAASPPKS